MLDSNDRFDRHLPSGRFSISVDLRGRADKGNVLEGA
jgi:hypothetical protein